MSEQQNSLQKRQRFSNADMVVVKRSDQQQAEFHALMSNHGGFSAEEKSSLHINSVSAFESHWNAALVAKRRFESDHKHGSRRVAQTIQGFAVSANNILQNMDPIIQLVKDFGTPYGGIAIGTISFLFTIANNRSNIENGISDTLLQIGDRVVGLKVYRHIYNDDHELDQQLQSKIVETYDNFIGFCISAAEYYSKGAMRRWLKAILGSPGTLGNQASKVQKSIVDIRYLSEGLLNKNVDSIKKTNMDQKKKIAELCAQIKDLQDRHDNNRLQEIQKLLNLESYSQESEIEALKKYQRDLRAFYDQNWYGLDLMQDARLETFKKDDPKLKGWRDSQHSCMLVLAGYNNESVHRAGECWLSPVALDMITIIRGSQDGDPCAFYIFGRNNLGLFPQVLSCIIFQLLRSNREAMKNESQHRELLATIQEYRAVITAAEQCQREQDGQQSERANGILQKVALRTLNMFGPTKTVWIILDRVDKCKSGSINHRKKLMKTLVYLVENATVTVRVLAVINGYDWRVEDQSDEFGQKNDSSVVIHTCRQQTASYY